MPADSQHPEHQDTLATWEMIRHELGGDRRMKQHASRYVPRIGQQTDQEFRKYIDRGLFFNAPKRAALAWHGMIFRKEALLETQGIKPDDLEDIDLMGSTAANYIEALTWELLTIGRGVTVTDWNEEEQRPYWTFYTAEQVINWKITRIGGRPRLSLLVVEETIEDPDSTDEFEPDMITQWRSFKIEAGGQMVTVTVERKDDNDELVVEEYRAMTRRGISLPDLPVTVHGVSVSSTVCIDTPPLEDICNVAKSHFNNSIDLENGRHIAGLPTPWAAGFPDDDQPLVLGVSEAWTAPDQPQATCGFLEFTGSGLKTLSSALEEKEKQMAALGARAIQADGSNQPEAFETVRMRGTAETASLVGVAKAVSKSAGDALRWFAWWGGTQAHPDQITGIDVIVNTDLIASKIDPSMLTSLTAAYFGGAISFATYFHNLQAGEIYEDQIDMEAERARMAANPPPAPLGEEPASKKKPDEAPGDDE